MKSRFLLTLVAAMLLSAFTATTVLAGEITGNGKLKEVNGRSECAFSGQEDLQWYFDDGNTMPKPVPTKGIPGHSQSWGQAKPIWDLLIGMNLHPGQACNPNRAAAGAP
jgi:hypothetical protein